MGMGGCRSRSVGQRIERAEARCSREVLDRHLRLAEPDPDPAADDPRARQVRVEQKRSVDKGDPGVKLADDIG